MHIYNIYNQVTLHTGFISIVNGVSLVHSSIYISLYGPVIDLYTAYLCNRQMWRKAVCVAATVTHFTGLSIDHIGLLALTCLKIIVHMAA